MSADRDAGLKWYQVGWKGLIKSSIAVRDTGKNNLSVYHHNLGPLLFKASLA